MDGQFNPYAVPLVIGVMALGIVLLAVWRRRFVSSSDAMFLLGLTSAIYIIGYIFELSSTRLSQARFWLKVEYLGSTTAPVAIFILVMFYTGHKFLRTLPSYALLFSVPFMTILFAWTNDQHGWIWASLKPATLDGYFVVDIGPGPWYWVNVGYVWLMLGTSMILLLRTFPRVSGLYRRQIGLLLAGILIPMGVHLAYLASLMPDHLDASPYSVSISTLLIAWAIFNYQFLDIMPGAREAVLSSLDDAVIVLDAQDRLIDLNPAASRLMAIQPQQGIGQPAAALFSLWQDLLPSLETPQGQQQLKLAENGHVRYLDVRWSPLLERGSRAVGRLIVAHDSTARTEAEISISEAHEHLKKLRQVDAELTSRLNVGYVATIALDAAMRISGADAGFIGLMEGDRMRLIEQLGDYPPARVGALIPLESGIIARVYRSQRAELVTDVAADLDYVKTLPDTRALLIAPLISHQRLVGLINLETSRPARFDDRIFETIRLLAARVAAAIDNSQMYEEREKLIKELDAFAHTVAHDLKNPITVILGYGELMRPDTLSGNQARFMQSIVRSAHKSLEIIEALLALSRVRTLKVVPICPLEMQEIMQTVCTRLQEMCEQYDAELIVPDCWPPALGYAPWIEQVWVNYISNALKYGGRPPRIELGCDDLPNGRVRFWVRDNGPGLTRDEQAQLFRPFTRLGQSDEEGHGLGLSIVQRIAERLNGAVGVESELGRGSLFYFALPTTPQDD